MSLSLTRGGIGIDGVDLAYCQSHEVFDESFREASKRQDFAVAGWSVTSLMNFQP